MGKYLIAGPPGSGKSSVIRELQSKNITAYDADSYPGMTLLEDNNGNHVPWPSGAIDWMISTTAVIAEDKDQEKCFHRWTYLEYRRNIWCF